jgi:hypothetical protein
MIVLGGGRAATEITMILSRGRTVSRRTMRSTTPDAIAELDRTSGELGAKACSPNGEQPNAAREYFAEVTLFVERPFPASLSIQVSQYNVMRASV